MPVVRVHLPAFATGVHHGSYLHDEELRISTYKYVFMKIILKYYIILINIARYITNKKSYLNLTASQFYQIVYTVHATRILKILRKLSGIIYTFLFLRQRHKSDVCLTVHITGYTV